MLELGFFFPTGLISLVNNRPSCVCAVCHLSDLHVLPCSRDGALVFVDAAVSAWKACRASTRPQPWWWSVQIPTGCLEEAWMFKELPPACASHVDVLPLASFL